MVRFVRSRPVTAVVIGLAAVGLSLASAGAQAAGSTPGANSMVPVQPGISAATLPNAQVFGNTPPGTPETVSFVLREQNLPQLEASVQNGVRYDLSVSQFAQFYGQSRWNIEALQQYLAHYGIATTAYADNVDVVATGTAGEFDSALSVQQQQYHVPAIPSRNGMAGIPAQTVHGTRQSPLLPYRIARNVLAILGLTNYGPFGSQAVHVDTALSPAQKSSSNACLAATGLPDACNLPTNFAANYGLDGLYQKGASGAGQTIAIVTLADVDPSAPAYFWNNILHLPPSSRTVTIDNVDGGTPGGPSDASGSGETDLDVEQSGGLAPSANVIVYQAPNTDYGFADAFFSAASQNIASSVSASWLESETYLEASVASGEESPAYEAAFDEAFLEMAEQGQSGFIAAGDWGAYTATADLGTTNLSVGSSADSPYITAAGGTTLPWSATLTGPDGTAPVNVPAQRTWGWDYLWQPIATVTGDSLATVAESEVIGSGGGFSTIEPTPSYQQRVAGAHVYSAVQYLTPTDYAKVDGIDEPTAWNFNPTPSVSRGYGSGRAMPDVSADADPYTGYYLYEPTATGGPGLQGGWGGTSFVAPQLNGSTAVIDSYLGHRVGFWNPAAYSFAGGWSSPFTPLEQSGTGSDNIYYTGTPGLDYNEGSGLGYPNLTALAEDFGR
ncbi:MAG TPA: S53 family peptidase [Candidatus Saccharimonadales bacterium]|nr:S53 family peptidase [Candidatus Saccharimonadales bacterium]